MNHIPDADPGTHPMSPYYAGEIKEEKERCQGCDVYDNPESMYPEMIRGKHTGYYFCDRCWTEAKKEDYRLLLQDIDNLIEQTNSSPFYRIFSNEMAMSEKLDNLKELRQFIIERLIKLL